MNRIKNRSHVCLAAAAALLCLTLPAASPAAGSAAAQPRLVRVFADHYLAGNRRLHDLDALEAWVQASGVTALRLEGCTAAANKALLAAAVRLRHVYLDLRAPASGKVACRDSGIQQAGIARLERAPAADDVRRYWESVAP